MPAVCILPVTVYGVGIPIVSLILLVWILVFHQKRLAPLRTPEWVTQTTDRRA